MSEHNIVEMPFRAEQPLTVSDLVEASARELLIKLLNQADATIQQIELLRFTAAQLGGLLNRDYDQIGANELVSVDEGTFRRYLVSEVRIDEVERLSGALLQLQSRAGHSTCRTSGSGRPGIGSNAGRMDPIPPTLVYEIESLVSKFRLRLGS